ncbi:GNAT family N-acetyltransferase [Brevibacterium litoralis]|uniref:GNAT family N-acetyltransferase n=1 Tax=Brevibacterium litoralis TaxID=3138935 RepID=UPI0032EED4C8
MTMIREELLAYAVEIPGVEGYRAVYGSRVWGLPEPEREGLFREVTEVEYALDVIGCETDMGLAEFADRPGTIRGRWQESVSKKYEIVLVVDSTGDARLFADVELPLTENRDAAEVWHSPSARGWSDPGYDALFAAVDVVLAREDRTKTFMYIGQKDVPRVGYSHLALAEEPEATGGAGVPGISGGQGASAADGGDGTGAVPEDDGRAVLTLGDRRGSLWADDPAVVQVRSRGFRLAQIERCSVLEVGADLEVPAVPAGMEVVTWVDTLPEEHLARMADVNTVFARDVPKGDLDFELEIDTPEKIREREKVRAASGTRSYGTALWDREADVFAGMTAFGVDAGNAHAYQGATVTRPEYRGRGLAGALKLLNAAHLRSAAPGVGRVYTWNAAENDAMLAINNRVGFRPVFMESAWERVTD